MYFKDRILDFPATFWMDSARRLGRFVTTTQPNRPFQDPQRSNPWGPTRTLSRCPGFLTQRHAVLNFRLGRSIVHVKMSVPGSLGWLISALACRLPSTPAAANDNTLCCRTVSRSCRLGAAGELSDPIFSFVGTTNQGGAHVPVSVWTPVTTACWFTRTKLCSKSLVARVAESVPTRSFETFPKVVCGQEVIPHESIGPYTNRIHLPDP